MRQTRSVSRQPSAGPSRRPKPRRKVNVDDVIVLTDSDDELPIPQRSRKRQKVAEGIAETSDLIGVAAGPPHAVVRRPSLLPVSSGSSTGSQKLLAADLAENHNKALNDLTNEPQHLTPQAPSNPPAYAAAEAPKENVVDPLDGYLSQILEVVPDVQPDHALSLVTQHLQAYGNEVVAAVLHLLFENPYPKVGCNKGKRKREVEDTESQAVEVVKKDYGTKDRPCEGGAFYVRTAMNQLTIDFPYIPIPHVRQVFTSNNLLYAPTYLVLRDQLKQTPRPFRLKTTATKSARKGKQQDNAEFERELAWLLEKIQSEADQSGTQDDECEDGIVCGCCFCKYAFEEMVQCPDAHLFCSSCTTSLVATKLGEYNANIKCMEQSGCKLLFSDAELARFLPPKLLDLYHRVKQTKEIEAAGLDGLEECPFCEYKVVIENPEEKLFRCEYEECGVVSCRTCKKVDHLPKSCKEVEEDKDLDARHRVEEAMTEALMRNCPKCKKPFVKESGCNKMTCPYCHTVSCYICRQIIKGYDHFDSTPDGLRRRGSSSKSKCHLWDLVEQRHDQEVAAARERAMKEVSKEIPDVDKKQLEVELPKTAKEANAPRAPGHQPYVHIHQRVHVPKVGKPIFYPPIRLPAEHFGRLGVGIGAPQEPVQHQAHHQTLFDRMVGQNALRHVRARHNVQEDVLHRAYVQNNAFHQRIGLIDVPNVAAQQQQHAHRYMYGMPFGVVQMPGQAPAAAPAPDPVNYYVPAPAAPLEADRHGRRPFTRAMQNAARNR